MTEPKHIGWLELEPRCKVWECPAETWDVASAHAAGNPSWTHCPDGLVRLSSTTYFSKAVYIRAVDSVEIRRWPEFTPVDDSTVDDGPTGETADALRGEGCVWAGGLGYQPDGHRPDYWEHQNAGSFIAGTRVKGAYCAHENREQNDQRVERVEHWVVLPKVAANLRFRGLLKSDYGVEGGYGYWVCTCKHTNDPVTFICERCGVSGKPGEAIRLSGSLPDAGSTPAASPGEPTLSKTLDDLVYLTARKKAWGDMRTPRESKGGPILICGEPGHVELHLEQLSDDRKKAVRQLTDAQIEMAVHVGPWPKPLAERLICLSVAVHDTRKALEAGWKLTPYLQAVRDAHQAVGMEREWREGKTWSSEQREVCNTQGPRTNVSEAGQAGLGWGKR